MADTLSPAGAAGAASREERIGAAVLGLPLLGFATQPFHRTEPAWLAVAGFVALAAGRVPTPEALRAVNWNFVLLFGVLASMPPVFASTARPLAGRAGGWGGRPDRDSRPVRRRADPALLRLEPGGALAGRRALITLALGLAAAAAGIDPWIVGFVALLACNGFFFAYQSTVYLALYHGTGGQLFSHAQARPLALWPLRSPCSHSAPACRPGARWASSERSRRGVRRRSTHFCSVSERGTHRYASRPCAWGRSGPTLAES